MHVDEASALEDTLARLRQRYALYFYLPEGSKQAGQGTVKIDLSQEAKLRYQDAEIHYRRVYMSGSGSDERPGPMVVTRAQQPVDPVNESNPSQDQNSSKRRSVAVNEDSEPRVNTIDVDSDTSNQEGTRSPAQPAQAPQTSTQTAKPSPAPSSQPAQAPNAGGWPRATQKTPPQ
jgi:hypothetical protein